MNRVDLLLMLDDKLFYMYVCEGRERRGGGGERGVKDNEKIVSCRKKKIL